ncbi:hypothetical protein [Raineyella fluvialis]|uniref:Uncharacterized protein n=1 Tax=Raineyella fluvialis TaxID=2662261 RepID=A0A5Q2F8I7_9ACTN|nr:hypothetical protein [Raineyella fluvialis]QGF23202.1 hypothetical protein Rai3103_05465 [Raineyella fluvialis]
MAAPRPELEGEDSPEAEAPADPTAGGASGRWQLALPHRVHDGTFHAAVRRLADAGVTPEALLEAYADGGDALYRCAVAAGDPLGRPSAPVDDAGPRRTGRRAARGWAEEYGGCLAVALVAAEIGALTMHLGARAAFVRARAVRDLLLEWPAATLAEDLGVARQKVYDIGRRGGSPDFIATTPWAPLDASQPATDAHAAPTAGHASDRARSSLWAGPTWFTG